VESLSSSKVQAVVVADCGHLSHEEVPGELLLQLEGFVEGLLLPAPGLDDRGWGRHLGQQQQQQLQ
jgi:hypothetical protein